MELSALFSDLIVIQAAAILILLMGILLSAFSEKFVSGIVSLTQIVALVLSVIILKRTFTFPEFLKYADLVHIEDYKLSLDFYVDRLSSSWGVLSSLLLMVIGYFSKTYLHREKGYQRFYLLLLVFQLGVTLTAYAANLSLTFLGWELIGTTSTLLIAFFWDRKATLWHSLIAYSHYRIADFGFLIAIVLLHEVSGRDLILGLNINSHAVSAAALFLMVAAFGKSAQFPFSRWLPRAMEGPTPSSAIFYGALSIHTAPFLVLRYYPLFAHSKAALITMGVVGLITMVYATWVGRTQANAKGILAFATLAQVGIIWIEIACGWTTLATFHLLGNAALRALQIIRAGSIIDDFRNIRWIAPGQEFKGDSTFYEKILPLKIRLTLYAAAQREFYLGELTSLFTTKPLFYLVDQIRKIQTFTYGVEGILLLALSFKPIAPLQFAAWIYLLLSSLAQEKFRLRMIHVIAAQIVMGNLFLGHAEQLAHTGWIIHLSACIISLGTLMFTAPKQGSWVLFFGFFAFGIPFFPTFLTEDLLLHTLH